MPQENIHHPFGPSSFERRELCPGSWRLEKDLQEVETDDSISGNQYHERIFSLIQSFVKSGCNCIPDISKEDDTIISMWNFFFEVYTTSGDGAEVFAERCVSWKYMGIEQYFGYTDVLIVCKEKVIIIDWKTGHRPVIEAANNPQGAAYALAAMQEFKKDVADVYFFNPVIRQKSFHSFNERKGIESYIIRILSACNKEDAPLNAGETQCRYCKAAAHGTCQALAKTAEVVAVKAETLVPMPSLAELPAETLVDLKRKCDLVAKLGERVDNRIKAICEESGSCGPYRLKESSCGREIKDIQAAFDKSGMDAATFLNCCTASVSKLEKAYAKELKESGVFKTEKEGKEKFNVELSELITFKPPKKQLVAV